MAGPGNSKHLHACVLECPYDYMQNFSGIDAWKRSTDFNFEPSVFLCQHMEIRILSEELCALWSSIPAMECSVVFYG